MQSLPEEGFLRLSQIIGRTASVRKRASAIPALIPVSSSTWWEGVRSGRFPKPVKLGRSSLWSVRSIRELLATIDSQSGDPK